MSWASGLNPVSIRWCMGLVWEGCGNRRGNSMWEIPAPRSACCPESSPGKNSQVKLQETLRSNVARWRGLSGRCEKWELKLQQMRTSLFPCGSRAADYIQSLIHCLLPVPRSNPACCLRACTRTVRLRYQNRYRPVITRNCC